MQSAFATIICAAILATVAPAASPDPVQVDERLGGTVTGTIRYSGRIPRAPIDNDGFREPLIEVDPAARGLRYALVYLVPTDGREISPIDPSTREPAVMQQRNFRFTPQVLVVAPGQDVVFTNGDPENHNIRAITDTPGNDFNIITLPGKPFEKKFRPDEDYVPIRLACDFHASMQAWVYIIDHANYAVTDEQGEFQINSIPPGEYKFVVKQPASRLWGEAIVEIKDGRHLIADTTFGLQHLQYREIQEIAVKEASE